MECYPATILISTKYRGTKDIISAKTTDLNSTFVSLIDLLKFSCDIILALVLVRVPLLEMRRHSQ